MTGNGNTAIGESALRFTTQMTKNMHEINYAGDDVHDEGLLMAHISFWKE